MQEKEKIREMLTKPKPITMTHEDWYDFKNAYNCHICEKKLVKENYWDSLPVYTKGLISGKENTRVNITRDAFFKSKKIKDQKDQRKALKEVGCAGTEEGEFEIITLKKPEQKDKRKGKQKTNCYVKSHCFKNTTETR